MGIYKIIEKEESFIVRAGYDQELHEQVKYLGGRWVKNGWEVPNEHFAKIEALLLQKYGSPEALTVRISIKCYTVKRYLSLFHRNLFEIAWHLLLHKNMHKHPYKSSPQHTFTAFKTIFTHQPWQTLPYINTPACSNPLWSKIMTFRPIRNS